VQVGQELGFQFSYRHDVPLRPVVMPLPLLPLLPVSVGYRPLDVRVI
jgi:hypothetical protein